MRPNFDPDRSSFPFFRPEHPQDELPGGGSIESGAPAAGPGRSPGSGNTAFDALRGDRGRLDRGTASFEMGGAHARQAAGASSDSALTQRIARSIVRGPDGVFVLPVKEEYATGAGARHWLEASQRPDYALREAELELIEASLAQLPRPIEEIREFGPGDGYKAAKIIESLDQPTSKYTGFDVNAALLSEAKKTLSTIKNARTDRELQLTFYDSLDLEDPASIGLATRPAAGTGSTVGMLLGQTLGNPDEQGQATMLTNIRVRLPLDSQFLVGVALVPEEQDAIEKTLAGYRTENYQRLILAPIDHLGLTQTGRLKIKWEPERRSVVGYFEFHRNVSIPGTRLRFERGDRIRVFHSHRFTAAELTALLERTGFGDVRITRSQSFPYALASARVTGEPLESGES